MKRLISQMEDDPLMTLARQSLEKILQNPDVITDEVFNNIMSKTQEVLDANYDTQVEQFLDTARSRGVTGDTLAIQLSKAKNARAQGMASAYRDALIARSKEGLTTSLEAINSTFTNLNNFFQNKRIATEGLVNAVQSVVQNPNYGEPFRNEGAPAAAMIGGGGGGAAGGRRQIGYDFSGVDAKREAEANRENALEIARIQSMPGQPGGTPTQVTSGTPTSATQVAGGTPTGGPDQVPAANQEAQLRASMIASGMLPQQYKDGVGSQVSAADLSTDELLKLTNAIGKEFKPQTMNLNAGLSTSLQDAAQKSVSNMMTKAPTVSTVPYVSTMTPNAQTAPQATTIKPGYQATLQSPGGYTNLSGAGLPSSGVEMGGGTAEAARVSNMIGQTNQRTGEVITPDQIIGTSAGGGVRKLAEPVQAQTGNENWKQIAGPSGTMKWVPMSTAEIAAAKKKKSALLASKVGSANAGTTIVTSSGMGVRK
jgi:hypothetical protein